MNIRHIKILRNKSLFGKIIRLPLRLIPDNKVLSILSGSLKSYKFIKGSHNFSVILGTYERKQSAKFAEYCSNSSNFWDLGAHVGYYSMLYHSKNPTGKISAFEPSEVNTGLFKKHMGLNNISTYQLFEAAVSDKEGMLSFKRTRTTVAGKLDDHGEIKVKVVKLSTMVERGELIIPDLVKMDIEGAEVNVLRDMKDIFSRKKPVLFVSTHGKKVHQDCVALLQSVGYQLTPLDTNDLASSREILAQ